MRIYGKRPAPRLEDEDERLIEPSFKRSASESRAEVERTAQFGSRSDREAYHHDNNTDMDFMDWDARESPMLTWLDQIAIPAGASKPTPMDNPHQDPHTSNSEELLDQEKKDIEFFNNVHIATTSEPAMAPGLSSAADNWSDLELPVQIYYRNIKDRYPSLPHFLTRRLAIANFNRATRLEQQRITKGISGLNTTSTGELASPAQLRNQNPWSSWGEISKQGSRSKDPKDTQPRWIHDEVSPNLSPQSDFPTYVSLPSDTTTDVSSLDEVQKPPRRFPLIPEKKRQLHEIPPLANIQKPPNFQKLLNIQNLINTPKIREIPRQHRQPGLLSHQNFWIAGRSSRRPSSVRSDSSSKNSSLRGLDEMDSSYQYPNFVKTHEEGTFPAASSPNRGLFPAPVQWDPVDRVRKRFVFHCEICGELVYVDRRRDWQ